MKIFKKYIKSEVINNIEKLIADISLWQEDSESMQKVEKLTDEDVEKITDNIASDFLRKYLSDILAEIIENEIFYIINNK